MRKSLVCAVFVVVLLPGWVSGQSFYSIRRDRSIIAEVGSGTANYFGEMVNPGQLGRLRPNVVLGGEYFFLPRVSGRVELAYFQTAGNDKYANDDRWVRNLNFTSSNEELSFVGTINALPMPKHYYQRPIFNVYAFAGVGLLHFNPTTEYMGKKYALAPLETEGVKYSRFQPVIPFGGGIKFKPHPFFNVVIEAGYRLTFTDYLDDASSTRYPDPASLKSDLSRALSDRRPEIGTEPPNYLIGKRGNPANNDGYMLINVKLQYYLPYNLFTNGVKQTYRLKSRKPAYQRKQRHAIFPTQRRKLLPKSRRH